VSSYIIKRTWGHSQRNYMFTMWDFLLSASRVAYRMTIPNLGEPDFALHQAIEETGAQHVWNTSNENLGRRMVERVEFTGSRIVQTAEDDRA
jgi:hypothetical protein